MHFVMLNAVKHLSPLETPPERCFTGEPPGPSMTEWLT